jgi:myo-inositol-1(or 4)-monophosphatase
MVIAGTVFDPVHKELVTAESGGGSKLNGKPIRITKNLDIKKSILATGFPHRVKRFLPVYLKAFQEVLLKCSGIRRCGSAALDLCHTACGRYGGFWELGLSPWDIAAGSLVVSEAGGIVTDFWGKHNYLENGFLIAAPDSIYLEIQNILSFHFEQFRI